MIESPLERERKRLTRLNETRRRQGNAVQNYTKRVLEQAYGERKGLLLGSDVESGEGCYITRKERSTHMHVIGATGTGKSKFLENMIREDLKAGRGVCVIDPTGELYDDIVRYCVQHQIDKKVLLFDPQESDYIIGFNPMERNAKTLSYQVLSLVECIRKVWGQDDFQQTPRLARWLYNICDALIESDMTFIESQHLISPYEDKYLPVLTSRITNPMVKADWQAYRKARHQWRDDKIESSISRLRAFLSNERIIPIVGRQNKTLNFSRVLAEEAVLIVNLAQRNVISEDDQKLIGTMVVNELITAAFARPRNTVKPYYLYIDEFSKFVTKDICEILDRGRKHGLHLTLAHQHLSQLKEQEPEVYYSVMTNARTKVIFGGLTTDDLEILGKEVFTLNPDEIKLELWQTKFRPVESSRHIESTSYGEVTHTGIARGKTSGSVRGKGAMKGTGMVFTENGMIINDPISQSESESSSESETVVESESSVSTESRGKSESHSSGDVPFYEFHEFSELSSVQFRSLEEQLYKVITKMRKQPQQYAIVKLPDKNAQAVKVPTVREARAKPEEIDQFKKRIYGSNNCYLSKAEVEKEQEERMKKLEAIIKPTTPEKEGFWGEPSS